MNRFLVAVAVLLTLAVGVAISEKVQALDFVLTPEHEERIRQNCVSAQTTLRQLHVNNDALLRNYRGKLYENISNKLMAPLNARITYEGHQGLRLTATTLEYDRQVDIFRSSYQAYDESMTHTLGINCAENPSEFYGSLLDTRVKRQQLHSDTETITTLLQAYRSEFETFAGEFEGGEQ